MKRKELLEPRLSLHDPKSGPFSFLDLKTMGEWMGKDRGDGPMMGAWQLDGWMSRWTFENVVGR